MSIAYRMTYSPKWKNIGTRGINAGLARMAADIHRMAVINAPIAHREDYKPGQWRRMIPGALKNSGRFTGYGLRYTITFGGGAVPYARVREYQNRLHPDTRFYLQRAGKVAASRGTTYFRKVL